MNYWWVNQKQTYRQEIGDGNGYMWSPKRQKNGKPHFSYEFMRSVKSGDVIFSYANSSIIAIGIAQTLSYHFPQPTEFGSAGLNWSQEGWRIDVKYTKLVKPLRTIDKIKEIANLLPSKYSPINSLTGYGNQSYLFKIDYELAIVLAQMIDHSAVKLVSKEMVLDNNQNDSGFNEHIQEWENRVEADLQADHTISKTEKITLIKARIGQGKFRKDLLHRERICRVTGVQKSEHLIASHIKPWRCSENHEKIDPENGFMLTPSIDHLFDKGFISFEDSGELIVSDNADRETMEKIGVINRKDKVRIPTISLDKKYYLNWHRDNILL